MEHLPQDVSQLVAEYNGAFRVYNNSLILSMVDGDREVKVSSGLWYALLSPSSAYLNTMQRALILHHESFDLNALSSLPVLEVKNNGLYTKSLSLCSGKTSISINMESNDEYSGRPYLFDTIYGNISGKVLIFPLLYENELALNFTYKICDYVVHKIVEIGREYKDEFKVNTEYSGIWLEDVQLGKYFPNAPEGFRGVGDVNFDNDATVELVTINKDDNEIRQTVSIDSASPVMKLIYPYAQLILALGEKDIRKFPWITHLQRKVLADPRIKGENYKIISEDEYRVEHE